MRKSSFHSAIRSRISFGRTNASRGFHTDDYDDEDDDLPTVASLLEQMVSIDDTPFLVSQRKIPPTGMPRLDRPSIRLGDMVRKGEFTRTYSIAACRQLSMLSSAANTIEEAEPKPSSRRKSSIIGRTLRRSVESLDTPAAPGLSPLQYTMKTFHSNRSGEDDALIGSSNRNRAKQQQQLLMEATYLAVLDHPGIVALRAFPMLTNSSIFIVTDRIAETLEERITQWRRQRRKAKEYMERMQRPNRRRRSSRLSKSGNGFFVVDGPPSEQLVVEEVVEMVPEDLVTLKTNYALQIANALEYLHARGIVVRELRPDCIGFLEYPNHHRVQLCDLSSVKELPMDEPWLPSTEPLIPMDDDLSMDNSDMSHTSIPDRNRTSMMNDSSRLSRNLRRSNTDPVSFRTTSTNSTTATNNTPPPQPNSSPFGRGSMVHSNRATDSSSHVSSASTSSGWGSDDSQRQTIHNNNNNDSSHSKIMMDWSARSTHSDKSKTPSSSAARNCYRAPEMYAACSTGYNAKVDCFSWSMVFYELLAEKRPPSRLHAETPEQLWEEVRAQRPSLKQHYFPLSIQQIIQQSWDVDVTRRYSSAQVCKALTRVLPVLEGKRLDGKYRNGVVPRDRPLPERAARVVNSHAAKGWHEIRRPEPARVSYNT